MQCLRLPKHYFTKLLENARFREAMSDLISMYPTVAQVSPHCQRSAVSSAAKSGQPPPGRSREKAAGLCVFVFAIGGSAQVESELRNCRRWREYKNSLVRHTVMQGTTTTSLVCPL